VQPAWLLEDWRDFIKSFIRATTAGRLRHPTPAEVRAARGTLTQTTAARLVHTTDRVWRQWEAGDARMHPAFFELFEIKKQLNTGVSKQ
jgi:DNA-binding transcriptional regulator YiaG